MNRQKAMLLFGGGGGDTVRFIVFSDAHVIAEAADDTSYPSLVSPPMIYYTARKKMQIVASNINLINPDAVLFLGDTINYQDFEESFDMFMEYWNNIDPSIKKSISAGNHDYAYDASYDPVQYEMPLEDYTAYKLGYGDRTLTAGSKFNESFSVSNGNTSVRFINFDTNFNSEGQHSSVNTGYIPSAEINWIKSELLTCEDNVAFLFSHKGAMLGATSYLNETDRTAFENMLVEVSQAKPSLKLYYLYGHSHAPNLVQGYTKTGHFEAYNFSALVDYMSSQYYVFTVNRKGIVSIETLWANYNS